jgi:hypothetical protein
MNDFAKPCEPSEIVMFEKSAATKFAEADHREKQIILTIYMSAVFPHLICSR